MSTEKIPIDEKEFEEIAAFQKKHKKYPEGIVSVNITRDIHTVRTIFPEPEYFATYRLLKIKCRSCGAKVNYDKLKSDVSECGECGHEIYSEKVCPKCGVFDCLSEQVINETVIEFKRRTGTK